MSNKKAIFLFSEEGIAGVLNKMALMVAKSLSDKVNNEPKFIEWFAEEFGLKKDKIKRLQEGKEKINFHFFEQIKGALGLSIHQVLGEPSLSEDETPYWKKQKEINPMVLTAPVKGSRNNRFVKKEHDDTELKLYVRLRAIHELAWYE